MFPRARGGSAGACPHSRPARPRRFPEGREARGSGATCGLARNTDAGSRAGPQTGGGAGRTPTTSLSSIYRYPPPLLRSHFGTCVRHSVTRLDGGALSDKVSGSDSASSDTTTPRSSSGQPGLLCFDARPKKAPRYERGQRTHWTEVGLRRKLGPKTELIFERKRCLKWDKNLQL